MRWRRKPRTPRSWPSQPDQQPSHHVEGSKTPDRRPYFELPTLEHACFEDSYVLTLDVTATSVEFRIDLVLAKAHPEYHPPKPGELNCHRHARLRFDGITRVVWAPSGDIPSRDANGVLDLGNIDSFFEVDGEYQLYGDWGTLDVRSEPPVLTLEPED